MTMNDLERQNRFLMDLFADFKLRDTFQAIISPKSNAIDIWRSRVGFIKFLALNVDFDGPSLNFLGSGKPAQKGIKARYPRKSHFRPIVVGQSFVKTVAPDRHAACHNKH